MSILNDRLSPTDRILDTYGIGYAGTFTPFPYVADAPFRLMITGFCGRTASDDVIELFLLYQTIRRISIF